MFDQFRVPPPIDDLKVVVRPLSHLKSNPRNARTHSRRQICQIADSIEAFGFNNPILVDKGGMILAGHAQPRRGRGAFLFPKRQSRWVLTVPALKIR